MTAPGIFLFKSGMRSALCSLSTSTRIKSGLKACIWPKASPAVAYLALTSNPARLRTTLVRRSIIILFSSIRTVLYAKTPHLLKKKPAEEPAFRIFVLFFFCSRFCIFINHPADFARQLGISRFLNQWLSELD